MASGPMSGVYQVWDILMFWGIWAVLQIRRLGWFTLKMRGHHGLRRCCKLYFFKLGPFTRPNTARARFGCWISVEFHLYPLVIQHSYGKSPFSMGTSTILYMGIFNSYVCLPEGTTANRASKTVIALFAIVCITFRGTDSHTLCLSKDGSTRWYPSN